MPALSVVAVAELLLELDPIKVYLIYVVAVK